MLETRAARNLSVVIISLNEEARLGACLDSLPPGAEIVVLDSGSTDGTVALARAQGARVETRAFTNYGDQKNAAILLATRPWILSVDADEVLSRDLCLEIVDVTEGPSRRFAGYRVRRKLVFMGRKLRFGKSSDRPLRLFQRGQGHFQSAIHEHLDLGQRKVGELRGELLHYSYADLTDYFHRFNIYTSRIAENHAHTRPLKPPFLAHVARPWVEFVMRYFIRLGFLDGYPGYTYALISSLYAFVKYAKGREHSYRDPERSQNS